MGIGDFITGIVMVSLSVFLILKNFGIIKIGRILQPHMLNASNPKKLKDKVDNTSIDKGYVTIISIIMFLVGLLFLMTSLYR